MCSSDLWVRRYGGTTLGRQELEGELLTDVPGALWHREMIEVSRRHKGEPYQQVTFTP